MTQAPSEMERSVPLSKRAMKRLRREAARNGAIILPGDRVPELTYDQKMRWSDSDWRFRDAIKRLDESLARTKEWLAEHDGRPASRATCSHASHRAAARLGPTGFDQAQGEK